ncbi:hypothetical protein [Salmonella phage vB_SenS_SB13]|uniref:Uncharacterized protein n=1 Tax=Salmonella phage vB_SenS_SB13 TaxID=2591135 RepID=A0A5J6TBJ5_9CAUD|nr:hypothetical protein HWC37_gp136 [Salmonella phage vB_SenS_SB13]QFG07698.1 hypothetical protein [Salmonella phage vB_SenS_SB13]
MSNVAALLINSPIETLLSSMASCTNSLPKSSNRYSVPFIVIL